jgi:hypothetical protein
MTEAAASLSESSDQELWKTHPNRDRILLVIGAIACYVIFRFVASLLGVPRDPGFDASLLHQPSSLLVIVVVVATLVACTLLGSLVAGIVHFEAGLFCACVGLIALSVRGGPMRDTIINARGSGVFVMLAIELLLLSAGIAVAWITLLVLREQGWLRGDEERATHIDREEIPSQTALAIGVQIAVMFVMMLLLSGTDQKGQAIWSVAIAAMLGTLAAHSLFPIRPAAWFLIGPLLLGVVGYIAASATGGYSSLGQVGGFFPPLARPLPLDYAAMGPAGALFGYWISRNWYLEREGLPESEEQVEQALEQR